MTQQFIDMWRETAQAFDQRYQAVSAEQQQAATPCDEWCVQDVIDHVAGVQGGFAGDMVGAEVAEGATWPQVHQAVNAALDNEGALEGMTNHPAFGEVPKTMLFGIGISDMLVHTWDLARAIGADETLPAGPVQASFMGLQQMPEEARVGSGMFSAPIEIAADADMQTQLIAFTGRQP